jgi:hypothetical protein
MMSPAIDPEPMRPPINTWLLDDGRLKYHAIKSQTIAPVLQNNIYCRKFWLNNPLSNCSCYSSAKHKGPIVCYRAIATACIGFKTLPTTVAIEFAES